MGYTTDFQGEFEIEPQLKPEQIVYLKKFSETRRMTRNAELTKNRKDTIREAVGLSVGIEGEFFVGETGSYGQDHGKDVIDNNTGPNTQPGLWCQWIPTDDGYKLVWNGAQKFYNYIEWLHYMIDNFFEPWGYKLNGTIKWSGEYPEDIGKIVVKNNKVKIKTGKIVYR